MSEDAVIQNAPLVLSGGSAENIRAVATVLRDGGVCVVPTDTVYGLAASIFQPDAVTRVFRLKRRAPETAVPILLATAADLPLLTDTILDDAWLLIDTFWPGPLTLVFPARRTVSPLITGGGSTVAVRVPAGRTILSLLEFLGEPIVGTSANLHGEPATGIGMEALASVGAACDAVLIDDSLPVADAASTVAEVQPDQVVIHRVGAIPAENIRRVVGARVHVRR